MARVSIGSIGHRFFLANSISIRRPCITPRSASHSRFSFRCVGGIITMRTVFGGSTAGARKIGGQVLQPDQERPEVIEKSDAKPVRHVTRISGNRIHFRDLAVMAWPTKTENHLAFYGRVDARTARRWLADDSEPPAEMLGVILAEIMKRFHQRD